MKTAISALVILLLSNIPSMYYQWYIKLLWFDSAQHFLGGFFVAMLVWSYFKKRLPKNNLDNLIIVVGVTTLIGVLWEFSEFIANQTLIYPLYHYYGFHGYFMGDLRDTVKDLALDTSGAIIYYSLHLLRHRDSHKS